jgi:Cu/Ag efflux protein CusF
MAAALQLLASKEVAMNRLRPVLLIAAALPWVTAVHAQEGSTDRPVAMAGQLIQTSAKVKKVDLEKRELTLEATGGKPFTVEVPQSVSRLENVKVGDVIDTSFYQSMAISLAKPGEAKVGTEKETVRQPAPGALPGGAVAQQITTTAKITKVDPAKDEVTIKAADGATNTLKVADPQIRAKLDTLKVGDKVQATYTEAMATTVTPKKHM